MWDIMYVYPTLMYVCTGCNPLALGQEYVVNDKRSAFAGTPAKVHIIPNVRSVNGSVGKH